MRRPWLPLRYVPGAICLLLSLTAAALPSGFTQDVLASGLRLPTAFAHLPDGRILIAEKSGLVRLYKNGAVLDEPFLDLRGRVNDYWDRGLLGLAVDPDFARNGFVYLLYTYENDASDYEGPKTGRLARYTAVGDSASPDSEAVLLGSAVGRSCHDFPAGTDCIPSDSPSHTVGDVHFSLDGASLFVSLGDGASFNFVDADALRAQELDSLAGKVLRITPAGEGLPSNPYWNGSATANRSKVWNLGLRNPFRFGLRPGSGLPYLGDVGWGDFEEINVGTAGANFGWPCYEGTVRQSGYAALAECQALYERGASAVKPPLYAWPHDGAAAAAVGGTFYTGDTWPEAYHGAYFFGDYSLGWLRTLRVDDQDNLVPGSVSEFEPDTGGVVALASGPDTHLYYLSIGAGELRRIRYTGANSPPLAAVSASPTSGSAPLTVQFSSAGSSDPEDEPLSYTWDFGDGSPTSSLPHPTHTYSATGTYLARLTVEDARGATSSAVVAITVGNHAPTATIHSPSPSTLFRVGEVITLSGSATDVEDGALPGSALAWTITLYHCPGGVCHPHPLLSRTGAEGSFTIPDHGEEFFIEVRLTATDSNGLSDTKSVTLQPQTVRLTLDTSPSGLEVVYDGRAGTAPLTVTTVVGSSHTISAPSPQGGLVFKSWSDGGALMHTVTAGTTDAVYTATFGPPEPVTCPAGTLRAEYFPNRTLSGLPAVVRCESAPFHYDWGVGSPPGTGVGPDNFSVRWTGRYFFSTGLYRFTVTGDDGVRLWLGGGAPIINGWRDQAPTQYRTFLFVPGGTHEVRLEYYEAGGGAVCGLRWEKVWP
jgi:glucose/arabinose dehydrogenase